MKMYLSTVKCGWVTENPAGNRLRWHYPTQELESPDQFLGFPEIIVVERALLNEDFPNNSGTCSLSPASKNIPLNWWDDHGDINVPGFIPRIHRLTTPVQAVSFTYYGPTARYLVKDSSTNSLITHGIIKNGDFFSFEAPMMDEFIFLSTPALLKDFRTVDLFVDRGLRWEPIAELSVKNTSDAIFNDIRIRYDNPTTITHTEWAELVEIANKAHSSTPLSIDPTEPTPWDNFHTVLGIRWEFALLYGFGFFDGPHGSICNLDQVNIDILLQDAPRQAVAYRVYEQTDRGVGPSNIVVCPPFVAPTLLSPGVPDYMNAEVAMTDEEKFEATFGMRWQQQDSSAIGIEIEEEIGASATLGTSSSVHTFESRSQQPDDPPMHGSLARNLEVPFHDVTLSARARATDAWDRVSSYSAWYAAIPLPLRHEPPAPTLFDASYSEGTVRIKRQVDDPDFPNWEPDKIVRLASGNVFVYRQISQPRVENVSVSVPIHVEGRVYKTTIPGVVNPADFESGYLITDNFKSAISKIVGSDFYFEASEEGGTAVSLFDAGAAKLQQNPVDPTLWLKVAEFPVVNLPDELVFSDPLPVLTDTAEMVSYHTRISFLGRIGPPANIVQAIRIPVTPVVPPPFSVDILGIDFYNRTMVKVRFTNPVTVGKYSIWWADGAYDNSTFGSKAVPGENIAQSAQSQRFLYDVLAIPIPRNLDRTITIGVQRVNDAQGQSNFETVHLTLSAA